MNRWAPAAVGMGGIVASTVGADVWAAVTGRPTISRSIANCLEHPVLGPVVFGGLCGLGWHLVVDPIVRRLSDA